MDLDAMRELVAREVASALGQVTLPATVQSVNGDGTVNLTLKGATVPSCPALRSYSPRAAGDVVLVRPHGGEFVVLGRAGAPAAGGIVPAITLSDSAAPAGVGWEAVVTGQLWARVTSSGQELWCKRVTAAPASTTITRTSTYAYTYRSSGVTQTALAEQGDYGGYGMQTGLFCFGAGAWSGLSGHPPVSALLEIHRDTQGGYTWDRVPLVIYRAAYDTPPASVPTYTAGAVGISVSTNETGKLTITDTAWLAPFATGAATALVLSTPTAHDNAQCDWARLSITY